VPRLWEPLPQGTRAQRLRGEVQPAYLIAVILVKGRAGLAEFTDAAVARS